jgi:hypothetical protein
MSYKDRKDPANLFLDAINGGVGALGFVGATEKSWEVVASGIDMFRFVGDKILMEYRKSGPEDYVKWQASYQAVLEALKQFAKDHAPMGLAWQPAHSGIDISEYVPGQSVSTSGPVATAPSASAPAAAPAPAGGSNDAVGAWGSIVNGSLAAFLSLSNEVGDEIAEMGGSLAGGFGAVDDLLKKAAVCKKPSDMSSVFGDLQTNLSAVSSTKPPKRSSPLDLHYKCLKSSVNCLAFVAVDTKSWETVNAALEEMEFNGNKLLSQFRKTGPELYVNWHAALKKLLQEVSQFAKDHAPCGLKWSLDGMDISAYTADPRAAKAPAAGAPGGKSMGKGGKSGPAKSAFQIKCEKEGLDYKVELEKMKADSEKRRAELAAGPKQVAAADALFAELNALGADGGSLKSKLGLKKTVKGTAKDRKVVNSSARKKTSGGGTAKKTVRPLFEGYEGTDLLKLAYCYGTRQSKERKTLTVSEPRKDAVLIMECDDVAIDIVGVCKNISIAGCTRFNVTLEGSIGQVEVSNCGSGYVTVNGRIFQLTCDKCEGLEVTLTPDAYGAKIVSSMCSSLNIALDNPDKDAEMELLTLAVPTQYETRLVINEEKKTADLVTEAVSHNFG